MIPCCDRLVSPKLWTRHPEPCQMPRNRNHEENLLLREAPIDSSTNSEVETGAPLDTRGRPKPRDPRPVVPKIFLDEILGPHSAPNMCNFRSMVVHFPNSLDRKRKDDGRAWRASAHLPDVPDSLPGSHSWPRRSSWPVSWNWDAVRESNDRGVLPVADRLNRLRGSPAPSETQ